MSAWDRRHFIASAGALSLLGSQATRAKGRDKRPNILFILADDLGYADLSCYGRRGYETPALDRFADEGLRFTQAYPNSSVCSPTRVALATGRYQYRASICSKRAGSAPGIPAAPFQRERSGGIPPMKQPCQPRSCL